jgi:hypothetical protein
VQADGSPTEVHKSTFLHEMTFTHHILTIYIYDDTSTRAYSIEK